MLTAQAGEPWEPFVDACVADGLAGVESLAGIPGSIGATPIQNVGAYGQEVAQTVTAVRVLDRERDVVEDLPAADAGFAYRSSAFKRTPGRWVVLAVTFALERRERSGPLEYAELARALDVRPGRERRSPRCARRCWRCGAARGWCSTPPIPTRSRRARSSPIPSSTADAFARLEERAGDAGRPPRFPEPDGRVKTSAAWLIERAGFTRGYGNPQGIAISAKHTLALTNRGAGTTAELVALAREIAGGVRERFGVELTPEPVLVGPAWP